MSIAKPSTKPSPPQALQRNYDWRSAGLRYYSYNYYLRQRFGVRVQRVSVDAGFTCPNIDGTVAVGGCIFCNNRSFSPSRRLPRLSITEQIDDGIRRLKRRYECDHFMAYFQPATNTYAPVDQLRALYEEALGHPKVVGLAIGTRPDGVPDEVLDLLADLARHTYLATELGMQSMHDRSLDWMNRGHHHHAFVDAIRRCRGSGFEIGAHVILGIPGETREEMLATADELAALEIDALKIHNLYAVKNTPLGDRVVEGQVRLMGRDEYVNILVEVLERLPPTTVIERICGDAPANFLVGPAWCLDKPAVRRMVLQELERLDTWQGRLYQRRTVATDATTGR